MTEAFTCEVCGETYDKAWSDDEAMAEAESLWPNLPPPRELAVICDDCFQAGMERGVGKTWTA